MQENTNDWQFFARLPATLLHLRFCLIRCLQFRHRRNYKIVLRLQMRILATYCWYPDKFLLKSGVRSAIKESGLLWPYTRAAERGGLGGLQHHPIFDLRTDNQLLRSLSHQHPPNRISVPPPLIIQECIWLLLSLRIMLHMNSKTESS